MSLIKNDLHKILDEIRNKLRSLSSEEAKKAFAKFVPNSQQVYGVRLPQINQLAKEYSAHGFLLIEALWQSGAFEEKMLAVKVLNRTCRKDPDHTLKLLNLFKSYVDNWAICDTLCSEGIRPILKTHSSEVFDLAKKYLDLDVMWIRRMGVVLLIHFAKIPERKEEVRGLIQPLASDKEHYIKKAIVWINRYLDK